MLVVYNGATSKFDDVLFEHVGLLHVLPLAVHHPPEMFVLRVRGLRVRGQGLTGYSQIMTFVKM